ncbi:uncharacterized protein LOC114858750 [Betta splendens]|uniref:Uncharacterized protein LOC114858750 n=1 Tax=Betta splendens TaxID=158456 RepID=A0A9W2XWU4_BETSP|nr:uncharacterized protein LOC114858750 [Betta splendens]
MTVFSGHTLTCHQAEYLIENECCPMCLPGSRVKTDCTEFRSTSCLSCLEGTYMNQPTGLKYCLACTNCDQGSGLKTKKSCTSTSDTICEPLEGFYCVESSDNDCNAARQHRRCETGQYISKNGTSSSDTECSDCSDGTFSDGSFTSCRPHTQCDRENLHMVKAGTASTDAECGVQPDTNESQLTSIITGTVIVLIALFHLEANRRERRSSCHSCALPVGGGSGQRGRVVAVFVFPGSCCQSNEYTARDGQCCPRCLEGTVVLRDCKAESGTQCVPCEEGTYMNRPNGLKSCFPCTSCDPGDGLFKRYNCTVKVDTVCDVSPGYFCKSWEETICIFADKHTVCKPGQRIKEPGTERSDAVCEDCQPGFFSPHGVNCTAWTVCSDTEINVRAGDAQTDVVCRDASRHHYFLVFGISCSLVTLCGVTIKGWISKKTKHSHSGCELQTADKQITALGCSKKVMLDTRDEAAAL